MIPHGNRPHGSPEAQQRLKPNVVTDEQLACVRALPEKFGMWEANGFSIAAQSLHITQIDSLVSDLKNLVSGQQKQINELADKFESLNDKINEAAANLSTRIGAIEQTVTAITSQKMDLSARIANARDRMILVEPLVVKKSKVKLAKVK